MLSLVAMGSLTANALLYMRYNRNRPLMRIGKQVVPFGEYQDAVDTEQGRPILKRIALQKLVLAAAKAQNLLPTDEEVEKRIALREQQDPKSVEDEKRDPYLAVEFRKSMKTQMALENLRIKDVTATPGEISAFYKKSASFFTLLPKAHTTLVVATNASNANTAKALLEQKDIHPDIIARQPGLGVVNVNGFNPDWRTMPPEIIQAIAGKVRQLPVGQVGIVSGPGIYFIMRVESKTPTVVPPLATIRDQVERAVKLAKAPTNEQILGKLYRESQITFEIPKYAVLFADVEQMLKQADEQNKVAPSSNKQTTQTPAVASKELVAQSSRL